MTLIIYTKCTDATIAILDRKESNTSDIGQITKKYYLPTNQEFILALAGESIRIDTIVSDLHIDQGVISTEIRKKLYEIIEKSPKIIGTENISGGFLLIKEGTSFKFNNVWFTNSQKSIVEEDPLFKCYGEGAPLADYLIRKFEFSKFPWKVACQHLIAIMQDVSKRVDSVGSLENYGLDLIVITDDGDLKLSTVYDGKGIDGITCNFEPKEFEIPFTSSKLIQEEKAAKETVEEISKPNIISVDGKGKTYQINYEIVGGEISTIGFDEYVTSLIIPIKSFNDGELTITIPRTLIDSKIGDNDDQFFVLGDGGEYEFFETPTKIDRTLTISFPKGLEEIEIIGTQLFGIESKIQSIEKVSLDYDPEKIHQQATERKTPIVVQTDKSVYIYGSDIIVTIINPYFISGTPINLEIHDAGDRVVYKNTIPVSLEAKGIYQEIVRVEGKDWSKPGSEYKVVAEYNDKKAEVSVFTSDFGITIELDQKVYSWTDKVFITVVAPDLIYDPDNIQSIGNKPEQKITISTRRGTITDYRLEETGKGTGIFTGEIKLTGFSGFDATGNGKKDDASGITDGNGPKDGRLCCSNMDGITVTLETPTKTVSGSALIRWNIGEIQWLESSYPASGTGIIRVVDPDMNLDPEKIDEVEVRVWSDTDTVGIKLKIQETGENTGIFNGAVYFTTEEKSSTPKLRVSEGDTLTAEYTDRTLPDPYSTSEQLQISATSMIGTLSPPLERIVASNSRIMDPFGELLEDAKVGQEIQITADLENKQNKEQKFAYLIQINDSNGVQVSLASISGSFSAGQSFSPSLSWKPEIPGTYTATIFVWEAVDNPTALSAPLELLIIVKGKMESTQLITEEKQKAKPIQTHERFPLKPTVSIPPGSSVPGCEKDDKCYIPAELIIKVNQTVVWNNDDTAAHTVTGGDPENGPDGQFDSSLFMTGTSFANKFTKKGKFTYFCMLHPWQTGIIVVE